MVVHRTPKLRENGPGRYPKPRFRIRFLPNSDSVLYTSNEERFLEFYFILLASESGPIVTVSGSPG